MNHFSRMLLSAAAVLTLAGCSSASTTNTPSTDTAKTEQTQSTDSAADTKKETTDQSTSSSKDAASDQTAASTKEDTTIESTETSGSTSSKDSAAAAVTGSITQAGSEIQQAFTSRGYTIYDLESEYDEVSFDARNTIGTVEVDLELFMNEDAARRDFLDETSVDVDESLTPGDVFVNEKGSLVVLYNDFNNICEVEAVDTNSYITYSIDDIEQADLDSVLSIMETLGFAIQ